MSLSPKTYRYQPRQVDKGERIKAALQALAQAYPHYGFKQLFSMLRNAGHPWNHKRVYRHYKELKLNLKIKPKKRLAPRTKQVLVAPNALNECWSLDYMHDVLLNGLGFRLANVIDDANREALLVKAARSLPARHITQLLDQVARARGYPKKIRVDNGPENLSKQFKAWAKAHAIEVIYIQPGKPAQNAYIERFNRTYRESILDQYLFMSIDHVQELTDEWVKHYNTERPHQSLGGLPPALFGNKLTQENSRLNRGH